MPSPAAIFDESGERVVASRTWKNTLAAEIRSRQDLGHHISESSSESGGRVIDEIECEDRVYLLRIFCIETAAEECYLLLTAEDLTERRRQQSIIKYQSYHDELTGLYNRSYMGKEIERLDTDRQLPISIIMVDIVDLKGINRKNGHDVGDKLLVETAEILLESVRHEDIIARWSGDDFLIVLPQIGRKEAKKIAGRIFDNCSYSEKAGNLLRLRLSLAVKTSGDQDIYGIINQAEKGPSFWRS